MGLCTNIINQKPFVKYAQTKKPLSITERLSAVQGLALLLCLCSSIIASETADVLQYAIKVFFVCFLLRVSPND